MFHVPCRVEAAILRQQSSSRQIRYRKLYITTTHVEQQTSCEPRLHAWRQQNRFRRHRVREGAAAAVIVTPDVATHRRLNRLISWQHLQKSQITVYIERSIISSNALSASIVGIHQVAIRCPHAANVSRFSNLPIVRNFHQTLQQRLISVGIYVSRHHVSEFVCFES